MPKPVKAKAVKPIKAKLPKPIQYRVELPPDLAIALDRIAKVRGTDVPTLIRAGMMNLAQRNRVYELVTRMGFGKYADLTVEEMIRCDPSYARWAVTNLERFELSEKAIILLTQVEGAPE